MIIDFINVTQTKIDPKPIQDHLGSVLRHLTSTVKFKLELVLMGDKRIEDLNSKFHHINQPTDVLSFPASETDQEGFLGSIAISLPIAKRQAKQAGSSFENEIKRLSGHGLLHLLGYHHR